MEGEAAGAFFKLSDRMARVRSRRSCSGVLENVDRFFMVDSLVTEIAETSVTQTIHAKSQPAQYLLGNEVIARAYE